MTNICLFCFKIVIHLHPNRASLKHSDTLSLSNYKLLSITAFLLWKCKIIDTAIGPLKMFHSSILNDHWPLCKIWRLTGRDMCFGYVNWELVLKWCLKKLNGIFLSSRCVQKSTNYSSSRRGFIAGNRAV